MRLFTNYVKKVKAYINKHVHTLAFTEAKIARHHTMVFEITELDYFFDNF